MRMPEVLREHDIAKYRAEGYLHVPQLVSHEVIDRVMAMICRLYRVAVPDDKDLTGPRPWDSELFDQKMASLRNRDRATFGALFDSAQNNIATLGMVMNERAVRACAEALGEEPDNLSCSGLLLRMDPPHDKRNVLDWHQDRAFFPQNFDGANGIVMTVLMSDTDKIHGAVEMCPGSHKEKYYPPKVTEKSDYITSEQRSIDKTLLSKYDVRPATGRKGDAYLLHMNTFHASGSNISGRIRYSTILRFHRMFAADYVPFRWIEKYNDSVMNKVEEKFGD